MCNLISFDQKGAFGPAVTLICNAQYLNRDGITSIVNTLKTNFSQITKREVGDDNELCNFLIERNLCQCPASMTEILATKFFRNMQKTNSSMGCHAKVVNQIVPRMLKSAKDFLPALDCDNAELKQWTAHFVECVMTEEQIVNYSEGGQGSKADQFMAERIRIGGELYKLAESKQFSEAELNLMLKINRTVLELTQGVAPSNKALKFSAEYLKIISTSENPQLSGKDICDKLDTAFRAKMYPKEEPAPK